ncbi:MAG: hypothetical protein JW768_00630 [Chitinispirillaceae bacterium]|nr:hypothetical protein [Chitinispirillaceae bacterium]
MDDSNRTIRWPHCAGQGRVKEVMAGAIAGNTLGHAYLFSGQAGSGTFAAALDIALILLCVGKQDRPCCACAACTKVLHYAHPDFRVIMPLELAAAHKHDRGELSAEGWDYVASCVKQRIADPYLLPGHAKVPSIPVDWIREINQSIKRGPTEGGFNVVIIDGIEAMNRESANSMLKLLEEPPRGTVLLLCTDRVSSVLPTVVSRCQMVRFAFLSPQEIRDELVARLDVDPADPRLEEVVHTGALGRSLDLWNNPPYETNEVAMQLWDLCVQGDWAQTGRCIDRLSQGHGMTWYERLIKEVMERARNAFLRELPNTENVFLGRQSRCVRLKAPLSQKTYERIIRICQNAIDAVTSYANVTLVLAQFAVALSEELHGKEQQAR